MVPSQNVVGIADEIENGPKVETGDEIEAHVMEPKQPAVSHVLQNGRAFIRLLLRAMDETETAEPAPAHGYHSADGSCCSMPDPTI